MFHLASKNIFYCQILFENDSFHPFPLNDKFVNKWCSDNYNLSPDIEFGTTVELYMADKIGC